MIYFLAQMKTYAKRSISSDVARPLHDADQEICPITQEPLMSMRVADTYTASSGWTYNKVALKQWLATHDTCPATRMLLIQDKEKLNHNVYWQSCIRHIRRLGSAERYSVAGVLLLGGGMCCGHLKIMIDAFGTPAAPLNTTIVFACLGAIALGVTCFFVGDEVREYEQREKSYLDATQIQI